MYFIYILIKVRTTYVNSCTVPSKLSSTLTVHKHL